MSLLRERAVGCLAGAAVGDAMGGPTEGYSTAAIQERYGGWVTGIVPPFDPNRRVNRPTAPYLKGDGRITDDTLMTHQLVGVYDEVRDHLDAFSIAERLVPRMMDPPIWVPELEATVPLLNRVFLAEKWLVHRLHHAHADPREAGVGNIVNCGAAMYMAPAGVANAATLMVRTRRRSILPAHISRATDVKPRASSRRRLRLLWRRMRTWQPSLGRPFDWPRMGRGRPFESVVAAGRKIDDWRDGLGPLRDAMAPYDTIGADYQDRGLDARRPSRLHSIEELPIALGLLVAADGDYTATVLGAVNYGRDADSIAGMGGALAGALGGLDVVPEEWWRHVAEASRTDVILPGEVMAEVAQAVFDKDLARRRAHETAYHQLTEDV